jgi:hypothetical protein
MMRRPLGVTLAAVLYIYEAGISLLSALATFLMAVAGATPRDLTGLTGILMGMGEIGGAMFLVLTLLSIVVGIGLLKLRNWGRLGTIALSGLNALGLLYGVVGTLQRGQGIALAANLVFLALYTVVLWYMFRPRIVQLFQGAGDASSDTP